MKNRSAFAFLTSSLCIGVVSSLLHASVVTNSNNRLRIEEKLESIFKIKSAEKVSRYDTTKIGNLLVPSMGIGTINWSSTSLTKTENQEILELIREYQSCDSGMLFDTAERYGSNFKTAFGFGWGETEKLLQQYVDEVGRTDLDTTSGISTKKSNTIIATKFTPSPWRDTKESVVQACEDSLERLGVDQIDLYQLHMPDIVQPLRGFGLTKNKNEIYWEGLAECYNRGLVKNVGVCNYGPTLLSQCHAALAKHKVPLVSNQIAYSLIGRHNGAQETVDKCNELGIKVLAYYPFAMGLLTGKYTSKKEEEKNASHQDRSLVTSSKTALEMKDIQSYANEASSLLSLMEEIAEKRGKTIAQVALNYVMCKGVIPIPGARTASQLNDNIGAMGWRLTKKEVAQLEEEADKMKGFDGAGFKRTSEKFVGYGTEKWSLD